MWVSAAAPATQSRIAIVDSAYDAETEEAAEPPNSR
jgi:hypothetical protein